MTNKKFILISIICISLIGFLTFVYAQSIEDTTTIIKTSTKTPTEELSTYIKQDFNTKYGAITLTDNKIIDGKIVGKLAEYSLISTKQSIFDISMEGKATLYKDGTLFDETNYIDKLGSTTIKEGNYYIEITKNNFIEIPDTVKEQCDLIKGDEKNGTKDTIICYNITLTWKSVNYPILMWEKYKGQVLTAGDYHWKWEGKRSLGQKLDVQPIRSDKIFSEWVWFNSSWSNKQKINLLNYNVSTINFTKYIEIPYNVNMNVNFTDIRFTNDAETIELPYDWDFRNSTTAGVWIRVNGLTSPYIYMYYNNPTAVEGNNSGLTYANIRNVIHFNYNVNNLGSYSDVYTPLGAKYINDTIMKTSWQNSTTDKLQGALSNNTFNWATYPYTLTFIAKPGNSATEYLANGNGDINPYIEVGSDAGAGKRFAFYAGGWKDCGVVTVNTWNVFTIKVNSTASYCYLNGVYQNIGNVMSGSDRLYILARPGATTAMFNGSMSNFEFIQVETPQNYITESYQNINMSSFNFEPQEVKSSCTYSGSGNWLIQSADYCNITSNVNVGGNNITINGTGITTLTANVTGYKNLWMIGKNSSDKCNVYCRNGGCFRS